MQGIRLFARVFRFFSSIENSVQSVSHLFGPLTSASLALTFLGLGAAQCAMAQAPSNLHAAMGVASARQAGKIAQIDSALDLPQVLGDGSEIVSGVASDALGNTFVITGNGLGSFTVRELSADGSLLRASAISMPQSYAYLQSTAIAVSSSGLVYVTGVSDPGLPVSANAAQKSTGGVSAFLAVLEPKSSSFDLKYLSYVGPASSRANSLAVDEAGVAYVAGELSSGLTASMAQGIRTLDSNSARVAGFVAGVNPFSGQEHPLIDAALLSKGVFGVAADNAGSIYILHAATAGLSATPGAFGYDSAQRSGDALVVTKVDSATGKIAYSANLGSLRGTGLTVDQSGAVYVTGSALSSTIPATAGAYRSEAHGGFVLKLSSNGSALEYLTYLGGTGEVLPESIAIPKNCLKDCGVYVTGITSASDFPAINPLQSISATLPAVFVVELTADAKAANYSVLLGDQSSPARTAPPAESQSTYLAGPTIAVDAQGAARVSGNLTTPPADLSADLPLAILDPGSSAFVAKIPALSTGGNSASSLAKRSALVRAMATTSSTASVSLTPASLYFGNQVVGSAPATLSAKLTNVGSAPLAITSVTIGGTNASQFSFSAPAPKDVCSSSWKVAVGASCTISIQWVPALGQASAAVTILDNADTGSQTLPLSGNGTGRPVPLVEAITPGVAVPGGSGFNLNLNAAGLAPGAVARWNGTALTTNVVSNTQATASIPASLIATGTSAVVTLTNLKPTALPSNQSQFLVASPIPALGFSTTVLPSLTVPQPTAMLGIDVNGDSKPDLIVLDATDSQAQVFLNGGTGHLKLKSTPSVGSGPVALAAGDFNEDGKLDLAVLSSNGTVTVLTGDGTGNYPSSTTFSSGSSGQSIVAADFDGDGHTDLAVLNQANHSVTVFLGNGAQTFSPVWSTSVGTSPYGLLVTDFNRDGALDLAVGNGDGSVTVLLGNGSGVFSTAPAIATGQPAAAFLASDFNEDGIADLAVAGSNGSVTILSGAGDGTFTNAGTVSAGSPLSGIAVADFNADGHQDLIVSNPSTNRASIFLGAGKSTFSAGPVVTTVSGPTSLAALDLNVDGYVDLAIGSSSGNYVQLQYQEPVAVVSQTSIAFGQKLINVASQPVPVTITNTGSLPLTLSAITITAGSNTGTTDFAQTNTCGTLPAKIASGAACTLNVVFTPSKLANESATMTLSDTNGGVSTSQRVSLTGTGVSTSTTQITFSAPPVSYGATAQVAATVTGSTGSPTGNLTLTVGSNAPITQTLVNGSTTFNLSGLPAGNNPFVLNYPNQGAFAASSASGTLSVGATVPVLQWNQPAPIATAVPLGPAQLNATASTPGTFTYQPPAGTILGIGNNQVLQATFTPNDTADFTSASISTTINVTANPVPFVNPILPSAISPAVAAAGFTLNLKGTGFVPTTKVKFNGKTFTPTVTGSTSLSAVIPANTVTAASTLLVKVFNPEHTSGGLAQTVFLPVTNPTAGAYLARSQSASLASINTPGQMAVGQFDSSGFEDLAILDSADGTVRLYYGTSNGTYFYASSQSVGARPVSIALGDFNEDGKTDWAVVNSNGSVTILTGNGTGTFTPLQNFSSGSAAQFIAVADLNVDGHADLAIVNPATNSVEVFWGTGTGTFTAGPQFTTGQVPANLVVADFNGDGYPDMAVNNSDGTVTVALGNSSGTYTLTASPSIGSSATAIATGDFNEDGFADLAVTGSNGNTSILLGAGDGTFTAAPAITLSPGTQSIGVGDFNGDGHLDLAVANQNALSLTVLLGSGNGNFTPQPSITTPGAATSLSVVDMNYDGREDIALSSATSNTVYTYFQAPKASLSTSNLDFGTPLEGVASDPQPVVVTNAGTAPLVISAISITPGPNTNAGEFSQTNTCGNLPATVLPGASCTVNVVVSPSTTQAESATLVITDNSNLVTSSTQSVALSDSGAIGHATQTTITPGPSVVFGSAASATITVTSQYGTPTGYVTVSIDSFAPSKQPLTNGVATVQLTGLTAGVHQIVAGYPLQNTGFADSTANGTLTVTKATPTVSWAAPAAIVAGVPLSSLQLNATASVAGSYVYSPAPGTVLPAGNNQSLSVSFVPADTTDYSSGSAATSINVLAPSTAVYVAPSSFNFNNQSQGIASSVQSIALFNTGTSPITVSGLSIGGSSYALYSAFSLVTGTNSCAKSLVVAAGSKCVLNVSFKPSALGAFSGTLTVNYVVGSGTAQTAIAIPLAGTGSSHPIPFVQPIVPSAVAPATAQAGFTMLIPGSGFDASSIVSMNGKTLTTQLVTNSSGVTSLQATVPAGLVTTESSGMITVANAKPTGLLSNNLGSVAFTNSLNTSNFLLGPFAATPVNMPSTVMAIDLNGDRYPDVVVLNTKDNQVLTYTNANSGHVTLVSTVAITAGTPTGIAAGDFNEDGKIDLAVATSNGQITILLGSGTGSFTAQAPFSAGSSAQGIAAADLNSDGHWDLVVTNPTANTATVLLGQGNSSFTTSATLSTGVSPFGVALADYNLDGLSDIAVGNADGTISVFLNSTGGYLPASAPYSGAAAVAILSGDFNEDGIPDLAILNTDNLVTVFTGTGTGVFNLSTQAAVGNAPQSMSVGDLNGDGHLDLIVANNSDNTASILYGTGAAAFSPQTTVPVAPGPLSISAADMNNDGRVDFVVSSGTNNTFSVLMQTPLTVISSSSLDFGSEIYGTTTASQTLTISNSGSGPLFISSFGVHAGYDSPDFPMTTTCGTAPFTLNPQASCTATISFNPSKIGNEGATFAITDNSGNVGGSNHYVTLTGVGLAVPTTIVMSAPSTSVYGNTVTVNTSMTSATGAIPHGLLTLTVGSYAPLTQRLLTDGTATFQLTGLPVGSYTLVANWAAQFQFATSQVLGTLTVQPATPAINWPTPASITQGTPLTSAQLNASSAVSGTYVYSPAASTVLGVGANQPLSVTFTPTDKANYKSTTVANSITVVSAPASLVITQPILAFSSMAMGAASATQTSTLINYGSTPVAINGIVISGTNSSSFQFAAPLPSSSCLNAGGTLAAGASCTLDVQFIPSSTGTLSASIVITDNVGSGSQTITLTGNGNNNPTPFIEKISPSAVSPSAASAGFTVNLQGTGFASGATLSVNGQSVPTTVQSSTRLQAQVPAGVLSTTSTPILYLVNPGTAGERVSNPIPLPITTATTRVVIGSGPFPPTPVNSPQELTSADFNQDGVPDVAVADYKDGSVQVFLGSASGNLTSQATLNIGSSPTSLATGDFNEDGNLDLAVLSNNGSFSIWFGDGTGNFTAGPTTAATAFGNHITVADLNNDGHLDVAVVDAVHLIVAILTGNGDGTFVSSATLNTGASPYTAVVADLNLDGILDLAVGDADGTVGTFLGNGDGTFAQATSFDTGAPASALTTGDFNEDGIPDLAIANTNATGLGTNGIVSVWNGSGNGLFTFASQIPAGLNPSAITTADFSGDGHLDLAVSNQSSNSIQVLIGSGASSFVSSGPLQSGNGPTALAVGDFNSDGRLDLLALDAGSSSIGIMFQQPQATLSVSSLTFPSQTLGTSSPAQSFTITNTGSATVPLSVSSISITPAFNTGANDFQQSNFCGASLPPGGTCTVSVTFTPSAIATENAVLTITDNSMGVTNTQTVALSGTTPLPSGVLATSQINPTAPTITVPPSFLGMSFDWNTAESWFGSTVTGTDPIFQQLLGNLMAYSPSPFQIRISGDSSYTGTINSTTVVPFAQLAQNMNVHYILGLNLDLDSVSLTQSQATAYAAAVPNNSIDAFEIGNEPDNYVSFGARGNNYGIQPYLTERSTFMQAVQSAVPNVQRFADPALASSGWLSGIETALLAGNMPGNIVTQHSYLACFNSKSPYPLDQLLQPYATYSAPKLWGTFATVAHQAGQNFRVGELNSFCQGGQPGLSNNFTSALWSVDTMFAFLANGVDGVNWHTSAGSSYNAFNLNAVTKSGKTTYTLSGVNPLYYGMLMFAQATGNGAKLLPISNLTNANLDVWATIDNSGTVHVVAINKDETQTGTLQISVPGYTQGVALPLTASTYTATTGVRYAGQTFDGSTNGTIQGTQVTQTVTPSNGVFSISVPTTSAILLNLNP